LRDELIQHVADAFGKSSELKVNCYEVHLKRSEASIYDKWYHFCNAPDSVEVSLSPPGDTEEEFAMLRVRLSFNGATTEGKFDCVGSITAIDSIAPASRLQKYSGIMHDADVWKWTHCRSKAVDGDCTPPPRISMRACGGW
jgi:hypothetical protein